MQLDFEQLQKENIKLKNELDRYKKCTSSRCFCEICPGTKCESCNIDYTWLCNICNKNYCDDHICHKQN